jgi:hypothetical protein
VVSVPSTKVLASAPDTKNSTTSTIVTIEVTAGSGRAASVAKNAELTSAAAAAAICVVPARSRLIAVPPNAVNHAKNTTLGTTSTPTTNSRIVRPREIRARNTPTNAAQDSHRASMK